MEWKTFFELKVSRLQHASERPYFQSSLRVPAFTLEELHSPLLQAYSLSESDQQNLKLFQKKILLRHHFFNSPEFERIAENFAERISTEKESQLAFSTTGGGVYLFIALMKYKDRLDRKEIHCLTSEVPLPILKITPAGKELHLRYRPEKSSYFDNIPSLWSHSPYLSLFEIESELATG